MSRPRRKAIFIRAPADIADQIAARVRAKQERTPDRVVTQNEVLVSILRVGLKRSADVSRGTCDRPA